MNLFFRILLAIYAFCLAIISAVCVAMTLKNDILDSIYYYLSDVVLVSNYTRLTMLVISLVFFVLSITFLLSGFKSGKDKKAVSKHTNIGEIKISLNSIENIALTASKKLQGIKATRAFVTREDENVSITIKMSVHPDVNIPELSGQMQQEVKSAVENSSGVKVNDIKVVVESIGHPEVKQVTS